MRGFVVGTIVDLEERPYDFVGRQGDRLAGTSYVAYVRADGDAERFAPDPIKLSPVQYGAVSKGDMVEWPCRFSVSGGKVTGKLDKDFDVRSGAKLSAVSS
jgi:hypothetical protein